MEFEDLHRSIHKEEEEAMEMKISIDQSKSDPCLHLLLSSSDQSSSSCDQSDSSLFSSLTSSPTHHGSFHGSSDPSVARMREESVVVDMTGSQWCVSSFFHGHKGSLFHSRYGNYRKYPSSLGA